MDNSENQTTGISAIDKDRIFAAGTALLALYLGYESFGYPAESSFFPRTLSVFMGMLALLLFSRLTLKKRRSGIVKDESSSGGDLLSLKSAGLVFTSIIAYGFLMSAINYEAASIVFLMSMMVILGFRKPLAVAGLSIGFMLLLYTIFFKLLGVSRPESIFFQ